MFIFQKNIYFGYFLMVRRNLKLVNDPRMSSTGPFLPKKYVYNFYPKIVPPCRFSRMAPRLPIPLSPSYRVALIATFTATSLPFSSHLTRATWLEPKRRVNKPLMYYSVFLAIVSPHNCCSCCQY